MAIRRIDTDETDEQRAEREEQETAAEKARQEKEQALEERARQLELDKAKAEAALDEARRFRTTETTVTGPTEAQWQELERQNPGRTREEIQAEANKMAAVADARLRPLSEKATAAEERAARAEEKILRLEARRSFDKVEDKFYKSNPALESHKKDVEDFLAEFPDNDKIDAKTYERRLEKAADYVRGRVKSMRSEPRRGEFSSRQVERDDEREENENEYSGRFDPKGTGGNRGAIALCENLIDNFGKDTRHEDSVDVWKKSKDEEDRGVQIDSMEEVHHARKVISRGSNIGGKRGEI